MNADPVRRNASIAAGALVLGGVGTVLAAVTRGPRSAMFGTHLGLVPVALLGAALVVAGASVMTRRAWSFYVAALAGVLLGLTGFTLAAAQSTVLGLVAALLGVASFVTVFHGHAWFRGLEQPIVMARTREPHHPHRDRDGYVVA